MSSLNQTPAAGRAHIAFFGLRNAGKSSLVNAFCGQEISIVSDILGTTTDPVQKAMELLPLGPVMIIDTAGLDDEGALGAQRVARSKRILNKTDLAVLVTDAGRPLNALEEELLALIKQKEIPFIIAKNKADLLEEVPKNEGQTLYLSAKTGEGIESLKELAAKTALADKKERPLVRDLLKRGDQVILVCPIDEAAPKGRIILPQQQTIRDILDAHALVMVCQDSELPETLEALKVPPRLIITDSQVFGKVSKMVPTEIPLTSFSILMARMKGDLSLAVAGAKAIETIKKGDKILIAEGCTHHRQCNDIGTVKLPRWIRDYTKTEPEFSFASGQTFPEDLSAYKMVVHCGGCTLNDREMQYRLRCCADQGIPVTNYGILIAYLKGILPRTIAPFPDLAKILANS